MSNIQSVYALFISCRVFEQALTAAGTDFRSDKLWDMYLYWEQERKNLRNITALCDRVLAIPTQLYSHHFDKYSLTSSELRPPSQEWS